MTRSADVRDPAVERAHFEAVVSAEGALYWADVTVAGQRRRDLRAALLAAGAAAPAGSRVLEIGCGTGNYTRAIAARTPAAVVAVDVAPGLVRAVCAGAPATVRAAAADVEALPFASGTFDAVVGNAVLHHLRLDRTLPELLRVLRPGGRLCFAEPNMLNPQIFLERKVPWLRRLVGNSPGETAFVRWRLAGVLRAAGLRDVALRPFDFLYPMTPRPLIPAVEAFGRVLERMPLVAEFAGSVLITARAPGGQNSV